MLTNQPRAAIRRNMGSSRTMVRRTNVVSLFLISMLCAACIRVPVKPIEWPEDLPPLDYYKNVYDKDQRNQKLQTRENYLMWVVRFYKGWNLYQDGWHMTTRDILIGIDDEAARKRMETKLFQLGKLMSAEWAKESRDRAIQSRELSIWGQALLKSLQRRKEEQLVDQVTRDVNALLAQELDRTDINLRRYLNPMAGESDGGGL